MHRFVVVAAALLAAAVPARAEPRVGVSMGQTLAGLRGLGVRVDLGAAQLEVLVGGVLHGNDVVLGPGDASLRVMIPVARGRDAWIGVVAGAAADTPGPYDSHAWAIEGGVHAEWFALPNLSLGLDAGGVHGASDPAQGSSPPSVTAVGAAGGGTLTFWF